MTNYYVRTAANGGSDAAAGTSAGAAWATIGKALGAAGIASGDTVYVGPGTYRESINIAMTSAVAETFVIGDVTGQYTGDAPGPIIVSAWLTDDDTAASTANSLLRLNGRDFLTFDSIEWHGAGAANGVIDASSQTSTNIKFVRCYVSTPGTRGRILTYSGSADVVANWTWDSCIVVANGTTTFSITITTSASADYDIEFLFKNCLILSFGGNATACFNVVPSGAGAFKGGGVKVHNCTVFHGGVFSAFIANGANIATSAGNQCEVYNSIISAGAGTALNANTSGQIIEDYNHLAAATARTNVSVGANSFVETKHMDLHFGQELFAGRMPRLVGTPTAGSKAIGRGTDSSIAFTTDLSGNLRPHAAVAAQRAWGALERHDVATKETSVTDAGGVAIKITGPYTQDIQIPVAAAATVITVRCRYDTNHANTNKPQAILLANGEIGVATETKTGAAAIDTWETLTFSSFTPTAAGVVTIRLVSRSAAANGVAYFDTVTVA